eukprot:g6033.t1
MVCKRRRGVVGLLLAGLALASGKPAWGPNGEGLKNVKSGGPLSKPGGGDLEGGDELDFDSVSPRDCADYLCVSLPDKATYYIEDGCPGQFAMYEPHKDHDSAMESLIGISPEGTSGVSTGTLLSLACASGIFAVGVGFVAGYKASPSFAYMRIPSLS